MYFVKKICVNGLTATQKQALSNVLSGAVARRPRYIWTDRLKVGCPTVGLLKTKKILFLKTAGFLSKMEIFL